MAEVAELEKCNPVSSPISSGEDDDEAPESVSFNQGREEALQSKARALHELQRANLRAKERRRERDRLLKNQKQRKRVPLLNAHLPEELLTKLTEQQEMTPTPREEEEEATEDAHEDKDDLSDDEDGDMDDSEEEEEEEVNIEVIQRSKIVQHEPHKAALQFLQSQLSRIPRESTASHMSRKMKRLGKPAMIFCKTQSQGVKKQRHKKKRVASDATL
ncbi:nucleolar protein 7-like [Asterias rubens]|uniref:nucleolar protein 7-like n=1 Tax=Asterias rubens TaxID=7604 RepID=UPI001455CB40|nr:nucleolar protein 7-like [Asterias rubens]